MASILSLIAGLVAGAIAGWLLRGRQIARTQSTAPAPDHSALDRSAPDRSVPAQAVPERSTGSTVAADGDKEPALVGATYEDADVPVSPPAAVAVTGSTSADDVHPVATRPVAQSAGAGQAVATQTADPDASGTVEGDRLEAEPVATQPVVTQAVPARPIAAEDVAAEPAVTDTVPAKPITADDVAAEPLAAGSGGRRQPGSARAAGTPAAAAAGLAEINPLTPGNTDQPAATEAAVTQTIAEPDDLTRIAGIGPKMAMALAASGITTFEQLAASSLPDIRAAVTAAGMRLAPTAPTWPEQAKRLAG